MITGLLTASAAAQMTMVPISPQLPTTMPLFDNNTKETIGTATQWGNRIVLRKTDGTFIATIVFERDGTRNMYDEDGKVLDQIPGNVTIPKVDK